MSPSAAAAALVAGSCRQCPVTCERVVQPAGCVESGCPHLDVHDRDGRAWMGCRAGIFDVEIDVDGFRMLQRTVAGFGGLRAAREPLAVCRSAIERTFEHRGPAACVNPDFLLSGVADYRVSTAGGEPGVPGPRTRE